MPLLLSQAVSTFLIARTADSYSPSTIAQYRWGLDRLVLHCGDLPLNEIQTSHIRAFLSYLQTDYTPNRAGGNTAPLGSASLFAAWKAVRAFYKWASPEFGLQNPSARIPAPRHADPVITILTREQVAAILKACEYSKLAKTTDRRSFRYALPTAQRNRAIILTLIDTGVRVSELCRLSVSDCNLQSGDITVRPVGAGIKSRGRVIPIGAACRKSIALYLATHSADNKAPLFRTDDGKALDRSQVGHILAAIGERANVPELHPHLLRHLFAVQYLRNGGDVFTLQRLLGHTSMEMTRKYLTLAQSDDAAAHRRASPVDNWRL